MLTTYVNTHTRRCDEKITKGALKVGVVTEGSWGPSTQWHHLQCTVFTTANPAEVEGYDDLDDAVQVSSPRESEIRLHCPARRGTVCVWLSQRWIEGAAVTASLLFSILEFGWCVHPSPWSRPGAVMEFKPLHPSLCPSRITISLPKRQISDNFPSTLLRSAARMCRFLCCFSAQARVVSPSPPRKPLLLLLANQRCFV